jgi:hypothetical protein
MAAGEPVSPYSTQQLNVPKLLAESTLKMPLPDLSDRTEPISQASVPLSGAEGTLNMPLPDLAVPQEQTQRFERPVLEGPARPLPVAVDPEPSLAQAQPAGGLRWKLGSALVLVVLLGGAAAYAYLHRAPLRQASPLQPPSGARPSAKDTVPEGAQIYLDQAKAGDTSAMRMLGVMYYYGLNVPQDREKGLYWYRQAADKGSETARTELAKLEAAGR